ncbi:MAG: alpha/beta hydrolase [Firmicutes bacterium]|nr:alpha/beta hydrolase [Bacillota bacterium]
MITKTHFTPLGDIRYYVYEADSDITLVMLPGLTADSRLFDKQVEAFEGRYRMIVWDAPGHRDSRPFEFSFSLADKAHWLREILVQEGVVKLHADKKNSVMSFSALFNEAQAESDRATYNPKSRFVLIGQSMGGYVSQAYMQEYPGEAAGFISIDSAPLQKHYMKNWEIAFLKHTRGMYATIPWKMLLDWGSKGVAKSEYGAQLMRDMMAQYGRDYYLDLVSYGYKIIAEAIERDLPYEIDCPALIICGEKDQAGMTKSMDKAWHKESGIPIKWIESGATTPIQMRLRQLIS